MASDDSKIRVAFIGCGGNARGHGRQVAAQPDAQIVALVDVSDAAIAAFRDATGLGEKTPAFRDHREMLKTVRPDAVVISTPHTLHFEQIMDSLDAGCHVLTEKPMVCTVEHAEQIAEKVKQTGKHLMIGYQRHFQPAYMYCRKVVQSGELGKPHFLTAWQCQNWYRSQQGKWRMDPALSGGGQLNDSGSHLIDIVLWILEARPHEVFAMMENFDAQVDILTALSVRFDTGVLCNLSVVGHAAGRMRESLVLWFEKGTLFIEDGRIYREEQGVDKHEVPREELPPGGNKDRAFLDLIQGKGENPVDVTNGLRVIQLTEAAWRSAETGERVILGS